MAQNNIISVSVKNASLKELLREIESKTDTRFSYVDENLDSKKDITINVSNQSIENILNQVLPSRQLSFTKTGNTIAIVKVKNKQSGRPRKLSGTVYGQDNEPIIGANIMIKGSGRGTATNIDGYFILDVNVGDVLTISSIGLISKEIKVEDNNNSIKIILEENDLLLNEVVIVGYGTQLKKNLSSAISKVEPGDLLDPSASSFEGALQGRAAGVQVTSGSALAGSSVRIRIRGTSSISASSEPLYVIDGIPVESGAISTNAPGAAVNEWNIQTAASTNVLASLNPSDIESLEVLKDAAAAAIYGSRGANGVVLITTKKGKQGKTNVNVSTSFGISQPTHKVKLLNTSQYIELAQEAWVNSGNSLNDFWQSSGILVNGLTKEKALSTDTNWVDETLRTGFTQDYNVAVSGGTEKTLFYISANMKDEQSILKGNKYQKFGARVNLENQISRVFRTGAKIMLSHIKNHQVPTSWGGGVGSVNYMLPIWPVKNEDGTYFRPFNMNPVAGVDLRQINLNSNQLLGNWFLKAHLLDGLSFQTEFGVNLLANDDFHFRDKQITSHGRSVSSTVIGNQNSWNFKNIINYNKKINKHSLDVLGVVESQRFRGRENSMFGDTFINTTLTKPQDASIKKSNYSDNGYSYLSYIGRVNYDFSGRYLLSASMRADGSSRFARDNRWGYFPAVSAGYIISDENYFRRVKSLINFAKIRASYGLVGNSEIGNYAYYSSFGTTTYDNNTGIYLSNIGDNKLGWEKTAQLDLGFNIELFKGRISVEFDYYNKKTTDLLLPYPVSKMTGVSSVTKNVGELQNKGFELMLNTINITHNDFVWETNINIAHNKNKVVKLTDDLADGLSTSSGYGLSSLFVGYPVGVKERAIWAGVDPTTGEDTYIDNYNNKLLYSDIISEYGSFSAFYNQNKRPTGNPWPKLTGGITNKLSYKNLYLNMLFTFATGMDFEMGQQRRSLAAFGNVKYNPYSNLLDRWQKPGDKASVSKLTTDNIIWDSTTEHLHAIDYLRLKDITIGYNFKLKNKTWVQNINIYAKCTNLVTFTKAPSFYWDPEYTNNTNSLSAGSEDSTAPQAKSFILGLTLDF